MAFELAIVGAGVMAEAITRGILSAGLFQPSEIIAVEISLQRREIFQSQLHIQTVENGEHAVTGARALLLCVKPFQIEHALKEISPGLSEQTAVISIAAGISSSFIERTLGPGRHRHIIRAMPNTPMLVGAGMVAIAPGTNATPDDMARARILFETSAKVIEVTEDKIDAVTAVSGSGPAYFFFLTEQMIQAGIEMGLTHEEARTLAIQTASGASRMMTESTDPPEEHRRRVTTPNGTTHAAISYLENNNWPQITRDALKAAQQRSSEMGK